MAQNIKTFQLDQRIGSRHIIGPLKYEYLQPNTKYHVYYKNYEVTAWCRGIASSTGGNRYGSTTLTSDEDGKLSFIIHHHAWTHKSSSNIAKVFDQKQLKEGSITLSLVPVHIPIPTTTTTFGNNTVNVCTTKSPDISSSNTKVSGVSTTSVYSGDYVIQDISYDFIQKFLFRS